MLLSGELVSAIRASIVALEPRIQAVRVEDVAARHEHTFLTKCDSVIAYSARRSVHRAGGPFLEMLVLNLDNWQLAYCIYLGSFLPCLFLSLSLTHSPHHFEKINLSHEVWLIVVHKGVRREALEDLVHPEELVTREDLLETSHDVVEHAFDVSHIRWIVAWRYAPKPCKPWTNKTESYSSWQTTILSCFGTRNIGSCFTYLPSYWRRIIAKETSKWKVGHLGAPCSWLMLRSFLIILTLTVERHTELNHMHQVSIFSS